MPGDVVGRAGEVDAHLGRLARRESRGVLPIHLASEDWWPLVLSLRQRLVERRTARSRCWSGATCSTAAMSICAAASAACSAPPLARRLHRRVDDRVGEEQHLDRCRDRGRPRRRVRRTSSRYAFIARDAAGIGDDGIGPARGELLPARRAAGLADRRPSLRRARRIERSAHLKYLPSWLTRWTLLPSANIGASRSSTTASASHASHSLVTRSANSSATVVALIVRRTARRGRNSAPRRHCCW